MFSKWEKAAREAEETLGLTRNERLEQCLVVYGATAAIAPRPTAKSVPKPSPKLSAAKAKKPAVETGAGTPNKRMAGPASRTGVKRSLSGAGTDQLPAGGKIRNRNEGGQTLIAPDGREFQVNITHHTIIFRLNINQRRNRRLFGTSVRQRFESRVSSILKIKRSLVDGNVRRFKIAFIISLRREKGE